MSSSNGDHVSVLRGGVASAPSDVVHNCARDSEPQVQRSERRPGDRGVEVTRADGPDKQVCLVGVDEDARTRGEAIGGERAEQRDLG